MNAIERIHITNITERVFPDIKTYPANKLFRQFCAKKFPDKNLKEVIPEIISDPEAYIEWLHDIYLKNAGLNEPDFSHFLKQIRRLNYSQSKIAMAELKWHFMNWDRYPENKK